MDNIKGITNCSQCGRGCHVSALMCGRGIRFFEILKSSDTEEKEEKKGCCGSGEGHHHGHHHGHGCGCGKHREHLPMDELSELIRKCNHYIVHHKGRGQGKIFQKIKCFKNKRVRNLRKEGRNESEKVLSYGGCLICDLLHFGYCRNDYGSV